MMNMSGPANPTEQRPAPQGVVCAKCQQLNRPGRNVCEGCGAHLHIVCHDCGQRNPRSRSHCLECGHKLHRSRAKRAFRSIFGKNSNNVLLQVILMILGILIGYMLIKTFVNWTPPPPEI
jgi:hypothetical protein